MAIIIQMPTLFRRASSRAHSANKNQKGLPKRYIGQTEPLITLKSLHLQDCPRKVRGFPS